MDDEEPSQSGLLSPRRIEAIHIAFTKVFDNAKKEGVLRDASSYRSFDEVFEIAMRRRSGLEVQEEIWESTDVDERSEMVRAGVNQEMSGMGVVEVNDENVIPSGQVERVQVVINSQETARDFIFSDDEQMVVKPTTPVPKRKRGRPRKRMIEEVDGKLIPNQLTGDAFQKKVKKPRETRYSDPYPDSHRISESPRRSTFAAHTIEISSDGSVSPPPTKFRANPSSSPPPPYTPQSIQQRQAGYYLDIPPLQTVTLVYQRHTPPKPRGLHIPFWGRRRGRGRKISLDRLWEVHYRLERLRKAGLPLYTIKSPVRKNPSPAVVPRERKIGMGSGNFPGTKIGLGSGNWRGTTRGRGRPRGRPKGSSVAESSGLAGPIGADGTDGDVNTPKPRGRPRGRPRTKGLELDGVMEQRSPEL